MSAKGFVTVAALLMLQFVSRAQSHNIFIEAGGSGGLGSVNYEYWFPPRINTVIAESHGADEAISYNRYVLRGGIGLSPVDRNNGWVIVMPMMANLVWGRHTSPHRIEIGGGIAPSITTKGAWYIKSPLVLGYRWNPYDKRVIFRAGYTPIVGWLVDYQWQHWFGVSFGWVIR